MCWWSVDRVWLLHNLFDYTHWTSAANRAIIVEIVTTTFNYFHKFHTPIGTIASSGTIASTISPAISTWTGAPISPENDTHLDDDTVT